MRSLALRNPNLSALVGNATRQAFVRIVDLCVEERVDALLLAGDLYDGDQTSMKTARFLAEQIRKLTDAGIDVFIVRGNHDALSRITRELTFPESVKVFRGRADAVYANRQPSDLPIVIHGVSFAQPHAPESLVTKYKPPVEGAVNIGLMHTSVGGTPEHDRYAPCTVGQLNEAGFQYWALGHVHKRWVMEGPCTVVMPGIPQGRDINEAGAKSVSLVTVREDRSIDIEERVVSIAQFERVTVNANTIEDWNELVKAITESLQETAGRVVSQYLVARLEIIGTTPLAWRIRRDLDLLKEEAELWGSNMCWIEKIEAVCRAPGTVAGAAADPLTELTRLIDSEVLASEAFEQDVTLIAHELQGQLPPEVRRVLGDDATSFKAAIANIAREGATDVLAALQARAEGGQR